MQRMYVLPSEGRSGGKRVKLAPGDVFLRSEGQGHACHSWDDCDGAHLFVVLPNGQWWDLHGHSPECDARSVRTHRCWVHEGRVEDGTLTVRAGAACRGESRTFEAIEAHDTRPDDHDPTFVYKIEAGVLTRFRRPPRLVFEDPSPPPPPVPEGELLEDDVPIFDV